MIEVGRRDVAEVDSGNLTHDAPSNTVEAMLTKQDAIVDAIKAMAAKLDADAGVTDTDYASSITDSLAKLKLIL